MRKPMYFGVRVTRMILPSSNQNSGWRSRLARERTGGWELFCSGERLVRFRGRVVGSLAGMVVVVVGTQADPRHQSSSRLPRSVTTRDL